MIRFLESGVATNFCMAALPMVGATPPWLQSAGGAGEAVGRLQEVPPVREPCVYLPAGLFTVPAAGVTSTGEHLALPGGAKQPLCLALLASSLQIRQRRARWSGPWGGKAGG